jgi:RsiW-degrading membrane proteinase PrsW (M82 family)
MSAVTGTKQTECNIQFHRPDLREKLFFFSCGVIMSIPITLFIAQNLYPVISSGLDQLSATLVITALLAPFIEEFSKILPLYYRHGETQRSIMYLAATVGLGFGVIEFISYVLSGVPWFYRLPGLFFHPSSAAISAYGIGSKRPATFFLVAVGLHFANNFLAITNPLPVSTSILVVAVTVLVSWRLYGKSEEKFIV